MKRGYLASFNNVNVCPTIPFIFKAVFMMLSEDVDMVAINCPATVFCDEFEAID